MWKSTNSIMGTNGGRRTNRRWPEALKREIAAASLALGTSVSVVARRYDVNANQVFIWRRRYGPQTQTVAPPAPPAAPPRMVPVTISSEPEGGATPPSVSRSGDTILIEVAGTYRVRVGSNFDSRVLARILDVLVRR